MNIFWYVELCISDKIKERRKEIQSIIVRNNLNPIIKWSIGKENVCLERCNNCNGETVKMFILREKKIENRIGNGNVIFYHMHDLRVKVKVTQNMVNTLMHRNDRTFIHLLWKSETISSKCCFSSFIVQSWKQSTHWFRMNLLLRKQWNAVTCSCFTTRMETNCSWSFSRNFLSSTNTLQKSARKSPGDRRSDRPG